MQALNGPTRIGRVTFSKSGSSLHYQSKTSQSLSGRGYKTNDFDVETGETCWISGPKRNGQNRLYGGMPVDIADDVREAYWRDIRRKPA